jgi:DNA-binding MarR family transcriptional regulator
MGATMDAQAVDHETRLEADDHFALKLWLRILTCSNLIEARIRHHLRREFDCTLPRFDLLAQLDRAEGLKMNELSQRLMVTGGNVTGLADQLQDEGWLVREPVEHDRRATRLRLTAAGRERFAGMAQTHEGWVAEMLGTLSRDEQRQLHTLLGKLKTGLHTARPAAPEGASTRPLRKAARPPTAARSPRPRRAAAAGMAGGSRTSTGSTPRPLRKVRP